MNCLALAIALQLASNSRTATVRSDCGAGVSLIRALDGTISARADMRIRPRAGPIVIYIGAEQVREQGEETVYPVRPAAAIHAQLFSVTRITDRMTWRPYVAIGARLPLNNRWSIEPQLIAMPTVQPAIAINFKF